MKPSSSSARSRLPSKEFGQGAQNLFQVVHQHGLFTVGRDAEFAPQSCEKLLHRPGSGGRIEAGALMELADRSQPPREGVPLLSLVLGEVCGI